MRSVMTALQTDASRRIKSIRPGITLKVTTLIVTLFVVVSSLTNFIIYSFSYTALKKETCNKLMMVTSNATIALDRQKLCQLSKSDDLNNSSVHELQNQLHKISDSSDQLKQVNIILPHGIGSYSLITEDSLIKYQGKKPIIKGSVPNTILELDHPIVDDELLSSNSIGSCLLTGYAPINDENGNAVAILQVSMDASPLREAKVEMRNARYKALATCLILAVIIGVLFSRYLTMPILTLIQGTLNVAKGNYESTLPVNRNDEFGQLIQSFNTMTRDLKSSQLALLNYNQMLEEKVTQRSLELSHINKELEDILDNMDQAIFTIGDDLRIQPLYSRATASIFGNRSFTGANVLDVFFPSETECMDSVNLESWLHQAFGMKSSWNQLKSTQPVKELQLKADPENYDQVKYIRIEFQPISLIDSPDRISKIMVIAEDITGVKSLSIAMEQKEQEYKANINQVVEIIKADPNIFDDFISDNEAHIRDLIFKLNQITTDYKDLRQLSNLLDIILSFIQSARSFKLQRLVDEAENIKNILSDTLKEGILTKNNLEQCVDHVNKLNALFNETLIIYQKILQSKRLDTGKTRTKMRMSQEADSIRINSDQLHHLTELIKRLSQLAQEDAQDSLVDSMKAIEVQRLIQEIWELLNHLRKVPLNKVFSRFPRMIRDLSREFDKEVDLYTHGEDDILIDKEVFEAVGDAMVHLLRNAVQQGIEPPEERIISSKPRRGSVRIISALDDAKLMITIEDDGNGLDISHDSCLTIVKDLIETQLKGQIHLLAKQGKGLKVTLEVPIGAINRQFVESK